MKDILLKNERALELLCSIIAKFEDVRIEAFRSNKKLQDILVQYSYPKKCEAIDRYLLEIKPKSISTKHPNIYELGLSVRTNRPVIIDERLFQFYADYAENNRLKRSHKDFLHLFILPSRQQRSLENTRWIIYFAEHTGQPDDSHIISGLLKLDSFNYASLKVYDRETKKMKEYAGDYKLIDEREQILKIKLSTEDGMNSTISLLIQIKDDYSTVHPIPGLLIKIRDQIVTWKIVVQHMAGDGRKFIPAAHRISSNNNGLDEVMALLLSQEKNNVDSYVM